jgi:endonuclease I
MAVVDKHINSMRQHYGYQTSEQQSNLIQWDHNKKKIILSTTHPNLGRIARAAAYTLLTCENKKQRQRILNNVISLSDIVEWNKTYPVTQEEIYMHSSFVSFRYPSNPFILNSTTLSLYKLLLYT